MKKPDEHSDVDFSEYMWMAEDGADECLQQQVEEEMELIEQDFLEAMFDDLLREEEEESTVYFVCQEGQDQYFHDGPMQLPKIQSGLNPNAPEFVPRFISTNSAR